MLFKDRPVKKQMFSYVDPTQNNFPLLNGVPSLVLLLNKHPTVSWI